MITKTRILTALGTTAVLVLGGVAQAAAQEDGEYIYVEEEQRDGLTIGVDLGGGHMECRGEGCEGVTEAGGVSVNVGAMLTPNFAIIGDAWLMAHREDRLTLTQGIATIGPQLWFGPFWIRGGVGVARAAFNYDAGLVDVGDRTEIVPAAMAAVGVELIATKDFALDVRLRGGSGFFNDGETQVQNLSLGLGANWF